ncbi:MAG: hypothetical protein U5L95_01335 [Candidatus Saccharibacteria bacterium]|nr:hypothetical protein [Candidatus Saccharibacteria bacterium]
MGIESMHFPVDPDLPYMPPSPATSETDSLPPFKEAIGILGYEDDDSTPRYLGLSEQEAELVVSAYHYVGLLDAPVDTTELSQLERNELVNIICGRADQGGIEPQCLSTRQELLIMEAMQAKHNEYVESQNAEDVLHGELVTAPEESSGADEPGPAVENKGILSRAFPEVDLACLAPGALEFVEAAEDYVRTKEEEHIRKRGRFASAQLVGNYYDEFVEGARFAAAISTSKTEDLDETMEEADA